MELGHGFLASFEMMESHFTKPLESGRFRA
jgi:hypothetical protein